MRKLATWLQGDSLIISFVSIFLGLLCGAVIMLMGGYNPIVAYSYLFAKVFGNMYDLGETLRQISPLILTGLAVAFAFRSGLFNVGGEGQFIMGMTGATIVGIKLSLPWFIHAPLAVIAGALFGGLWAAIAGFIKAKRGVNEVITTIMLNWIAMFLANYLIGAFLIEAGQQRSQTIHDSASVTIAPLLPLFDNARIHWGMLLSFGCVLIYYLVMWKMKQGYEFRAIGHNAEAAKYAGMNISKSIVSAMFLSGMFAGLAGAFEVLGVFHYQPVATAFPGYGIDGIAVALLGMSNPIGVVLAAFLLGSLTYGAAGMSFGTDAPPEIIRVVIGSIIFFVATQGMIRFVLKRFYPKGTGKKVM